MRNENNKRHYVIRFVVTMVLTYVLISFIADLHIIEAITDCISTYFAHAFDCVMEIIAKIMNAIESLTVGAENKVNDSILVNPFAMMIVMLVPSIQLLRDLFKKRSNIRRELAELENN